MKLACSLRRQICKTTHVLCRKLSEMLCLVSESKEATSRIAEVLELMSAHAHKQVFQSSVSSFLRFMYVGKLKKPFVYSNISVS